jgi:hypothetical protein
VNIGITVTVADVGVGDKFAESGKYNNNIGK